MWKKILILILIVTFIAAENPIYSEAEENELRLYSKAAVLMDADTGRVLYGKNGNDKLPMASTTKIMTLVIALENGTLDDVVTVSQYAASMPQVKLGMKNGEQYILKDLLYSLMLESHNDTAVAIAEHIAGNVEDFAEIMNNKALEIGCNDTYYITPNGLDADKDGKVHSTTARDLALVMSYCVTQSPMKDLFLEITQRQQYSFNDISGKRSFYCTNHNAFLSMMDGVLSGKTGFTSNAGYCYVAALKRGEKTFTVALLACGWPNNKTYKWSDTRTLMEYGLNGFEYKSFEDIGLSFAPENKIYVKNAIGENIGSKVYVNVEIGEIIGKKGMLIGKNENITTVLYKMKELEAPVKAGEKVGYISYMVNGEEWGRRNITSLENVQRTDLVWCVGKVVQKWYIKK